MDDKLKNKVLITVLAACWVFMLWWWLISSGGFVGLLVSVLIGAIAGGIAWFVVGLLS
jgi:hypothetical protein